MSGRSAAYETFMASTHIGYDEWHDGIGYDLDALGQLEGGERDEVERWLLGRANEDWRDLEALDALGSSAAKGAVRETLRTGSLEQRLAAARHVADDEGATDEATSEEVEAAIIAGLEAGDLLQGLTRALGLAERHPTPAVMDALFRCALRGTLGGARARGSPRRLPARQGEGSVRLGPPAVLARVRRGGPGQGRGGFPTALRGVRRRSRAVPLRSRLSRLPEPDPPGQPAAVDSRHRDRGGVGVAVDVRKWVTFARRSRARAAASSTKPLRTRRRGRRAQEPVRRHDTPRTSPSSSTPASTWATS